MATHSSVLAWRIPGMGEPGGLAVYGVAQSWTRLSNFTHFQKTKIMASGPSTSWEINGKQWKQCQTLFWGAPKSLQVVTAAMKLKDG